MAVFSQAMAKPNGGVYPYLIRKNGALYQVVSRCISARKYEMQSLDRGLCAQWIFCQLSDADKMALIENGYFKPEY